MQYHTGGWIGACHGISAILDNINPTIDPFNVYFTQNKPKVILFVSRICFIRSANSVLTTVRELVNMYYIDRRMFGTEVVVDRWQMSAAVS